MKNETIDIETVSTEELRGIVGHEAVPTARRMEALFELTVRECTSILGIERTEANILLSSVEVKSTDEDGVNSGDVRLFATKNMPIEALLGISVYATRVPEHGCECGECGVVEDEEETLPN